MDNSSNMDKAAKSSETLLIVYLFYLVFLLYLYLRFQIYFLLLHM